VQVSSERFDAGYYRRFYERVPVHTATSVGHLASGVMHLAAWWGIPIRSVLDIGAGPGLWRDWFRQEHPQVRYLSTDVSEYACERYGHQQRDISVWAPRTQSDLVVCQGVLQYLDNTAAGAAIKNLARATRHLLYLEVPTLHDREHVIDPAATDLDCHWRSGNWYRQRLAPHFVQVGAGLWAHRHGAVRFYELEHGR